MFWWQESKLNTCFESGSACFTYFCLEYFVFLSFSLLPAPKNVVETKPLLLFQYHSKDTHGKEGQKSSVRVADIMEIRRRLLLIGDAQRFFQENVFWNNHHVYIDIYIYVYTSTYATYIFFDGYGYPTHKKQLHDPSGSGPTLIQTRWVSFGIPGGSWVRSDFN